MNPGGKYIGIVRDPKAVLVSWYNFLKKKGIPNATKYESASEFAFEKESFAEGMLHGSTLWEYYTEYVACLKDPNVLIMVYEDLSRDIRSHLPLISKFMGLNVSNAHFDEIARLCSRENMMIEMTKFDETWTSQQLKMLKRSNDPGVTFNVSPKVTLGSDPSVLKHEAIAFLGDCWKENIEVITGIKSYEELVEKIRKEHVLKQLKT